MIANSDGSGRDHSAIDAAMMERCIRLAEDAIMKLLWQQQIRWCKTQTSRATRSSSYYWKRKKTLGTKDLSACTLYTIVEPCAMCSFAIRETRIGRVVFSIKSPMMGGLSKWNVLRGTEASHALPEVFGPYLR